MPRWGISHALHQQPKWSLRARLTIWMVAIFALIQWVTGGVFWLYQRAALENVLQSVLADRARIAADQAAPFLPDITEIEALMLISRLGHIELGRITIDVLDPSGRSALRAPVLADTSALPIDLALQTNHPLPVRLPIVLAREPSAPPRVAHAVLIRTLSPDGEPYVVVLAATDAFVNRQLGLLLQVLTLASVIGPIAAGISGWFIAGIAVAPFARLRELAQQLGPQSMGQRLEFGSSNAEVARLAQELDDARDRIQQAFAAQERFLSNVSHEIKTPLAVMLVEAQTLDRAALPPEALAFVDGTREEMARLGALVESFLTLSRVQDGKGIVRGRPYALNDLVMDSIDHCALMAEQHLVRLVPTLLDQDDTLDLTVTGEPQLLCTMLENLIRNAIRFSPPEGRVAVTLSLSGDHALIRVEDEGPGIPPDRIDRIFDRFEQAGSEHRKGRGHGLGLAIALGIAELHNGTITAANRPTGGCRFEVSIPVTLQQPPPAAPAG